MAYDFIKNFLGKSASPTKYEHDLSNNEAFSQQFGVEMPVKHYFTVPNEYYSVKVGGYVQTAPMREDNFATIKQELRGVFVPMSSIMRDYLSITSADRSTRADVLVPPGKNFTFSLNEILMFTFAVYSFNRFAQWFMSFPDFDDWSAKKVTVSGSDVVRLVNGTTNKDLVTTFTGTEYENMAKSFELYMLQGTDYTDYTGWKLSDYVAGLSCFVSPLSKQLICFDILRLLDQLEYGNYLPLMADIFEKTCTNNAFVTAGLHVYGTSELGVYKVNLEYAPSFDSFDDAYFPPSVFDKKSFFPIIAYQYYINLARRSNYRQPFTVLLTCDSFINAFEFAQLAKQNYGFDDLSDYSGYDFCPLSLLRSISTAIDSYSFREQSINLMNALVGSVDAFFSDLDNSSLGILCFFFSLSNPLLDSDLITSSQLSVVSGGVPTTTTGALTSNPVQEIKNLEALYKLRQDLLRAGVRRDKQLESIFGVKGNAHVYEQIKILDVSSNNIKTDPIASFAETEEMALGERGARGNGNSELSFKFESEDYGFLFITSCFTAQMFYEAFGCNRQHGLSPKSWYLPQFARLGLEPIRALAVSHTQTDRYNYGTNFEISSPTSAVGYSSHDWQLKTQLSLAHGLFTQFGFPTYGQVDEYNKTNSHVFGSLQKGNAIFGGFVPTLISNQVNLFANWDDLYYSPDQVNNLFIQMSDPAVHVDPSYDYFRCAVHYKVYKTSTMPKIGLLSLNV